MGFSHSAGTLWKARKFSRNISPWAAGLIPTPIQQVLSTIRASGIRALLMGGQACVFYGAAQVSKGQQKVLRWDCVCPRLRLALSSPAASARCFSGTVKNKQEE